MYNNKYRNVEMMQNIKRWKQDVLNQREFWAEWPDISDLCIQSFQKECNIKWILK